jgi:hypothetical protein
MRTAWRIDKRSRNRRQSSQDVMVGPHEDRELELMLAGEKPLAMFTEVWPVESGFIPEDEFLPHVRAGRIIMREAFEPAPAVEGGPENLQIRCVLYALPDEAWRIDAMLLLRRVYATQGGWDEGLERMIGSLLGYSQSDIDGFIERIPARRS